MIGLTPLIDVVFILLIFFMLASSFLDWRAVELKAPPPAAAGASVEGALLVEVRTDGLRLSGDTVSLQQLAARVAARVEATPEQRVLVRPSAGVALQRAVTVLDRLAEAGVSDISFVGGETR